MVVASGFILCCAIHVWGGVVLHIGIFIVSSNNKKTSHAFDVHMSAFQFARLRPCIFLNQTLANFLESIQQLSSGVLYGITVFLV